MSRADKILECKAVSGMGLTIPNNYFHDFHCGKDLYDEFKELLSSSNVEDWVDWVEQNIEGGYSYDIEVNSLGNVSYTKEKVNV